MFFHHNGRVAWISIAKNACRSWQQVFDTLGWVREDLNAPVTDPDQLEWFGLLRWPTVRHTMGVVEYLEQTHQTDLLYDPRVNHLLVSTVTDQHSYTVSQMLTPAVLDRTTWFLIDNPWHNYEILVQNYLRTHGVEIDVPVPKIHDSRPDTMAHRRQLDLLKQQWPESHARLEKNLLGWDIELYKRYRDLQHVWHRPEDPPLTDSPRSLSDIYPWTRRVS